MIASAESFGVSLETSWKVGDALQTEQPVDLPGQGVLGDARAVVSSSW
jgi:hypothetical protein